MKNWHSKLINRFKKVFLYLLLPVISFILIVRLIDGLRAPQLPDSFSTQSLHTIDGRNLTLAELSDKKPLLVFFWDRWCSACHDTISLLIRLNDKRTNVLTVASHSGNDISIVRYLNGHHIHLPVVNDSDGSLAADWHIVNKPTLLVVAKGEIVSTSSGWTSNAGVLLRLWWARKWQY